MAEEKYLIYKCPWGEEVKVLLWVSEYLDGSMYLGMYDVGENEPYADITTCIDGGQVPEGCAFVKNWSENEGFDRWIVENGLGEKIGEARTGFVMAPLFRFNMDRVREYSVSFEGGGEAVC